MITKNKPAAMKFPDDSKYKQKLWYEYNKQEILERQREYNKKHYVNTYVRVGRKSRPCAEPKEFKKSGFQMIETSNITILPKGKVK